MKRILFFISIVSLVIPLAQAHKTCPVSTLANPILEKPKGWTQVDEPNYKHFIKVSFSVDLSKVPLKYRLLCEYEDGELEVIRRGELPLLTPHKSWKYHSPDNCKKYSYTCEGKTAHDCHWDFNTKRYHYIHTPPCDLAKKS